MFARVSEVRAPSDNIDAGIQEYREVVRALQGMDGYQRAYLLVDRDSGRSLSITVWDSEDAMRSSEEATSTLRDRATQMVGGEATVSRYEVAVVDPAH